jgi:hypothetical protein
MPFFEDNLPRQHPRTQIVGTAQSEINGHLHAVRSAHKLTTTEYLQILTEEVQVTLKYCLRAERHPDDTSQPADVE